MHDSIESEYAGIMDKKKQLSRQTGRNKKGNGIYHPIDPEEINCSAKNVIELSEKEYNEDAFLLVPADEEEVADVLFVHASVANLSNFAGFLRANKANDVQKDRYLQIEKLLGEMIFFVTHTEDTNPERCEGIPHRNRQKIMRELKVVEVLVDILHYPFASGFFDLIKLTHSMPIARVSITRFNI